MNHDCVQTNGHSTTSAAISLRPEPGGQNFHIENSTVEGGSNKETEGVDEDLQNNYSIPGATANNVKLECISGCLHQLWTLTNSYVISDEYKPGVESGAFHAEDWYFDDNSITAEHNTLLNPSKQTAVIFGDSSTSPCSDQERVVNNLLAGGGQILDMCKAAGGKAEIKDNRFARRVCTKGIIGNWEGRGGYGCAPEGDGYYGTGEGTDGYWPYGGFFELIGYQNVTSVVWEGNYWDDNLTPVKESQTGS
jgi:hypothetical protein